MKVKWRYNIDYDFGMITDECSEGSINVSEKFWQEYCHKRMEFELMHQKLVDKLPKKKIKNFVEKLIDWFKSNTKSFGKKGDPF